MLAWTLAVAINCSQPRMEFRDFFSKITGLAPGQLWLPYETMQPALARMMNVSADYQDCLAHYRDYCK